nr:endosialin [Oryctolagus cuniculus]
MLLRLLLAWAAAVPALPALGQAPWAAEPRAACGPGSCYALFPHRRTFLEAWRACRELGGDLATPRTLEEAQRVDSLVGAGPASRLLWIGLQRPARQCQPQRPLRGFTWTTGDQDTAFTNWAQPATGGPCPAQRCAALEASGGHRWLEGSCTLAVDGYLCQFGFEGACPALPAEAGQAGPAVYTTPFHLVSTELEWLPFGSVAAVQCQAGRGASLLCVKQPGGGVGWSQAGPLCPGSGCGPANGGCEHECVEEEDGRVSCRCSEGFQLAADGHSCEDPCAQAPCEQQCEPGGPQGYSCHCRLGFRPAEDEPHRCVDTDECQIAGVCQQMCVNYVGGFECYCSEGHELEADGISCSPAGAMGARNSQDLEDELLEDGEEEEEEEDEEEDEDEEAWEGFDSTWTEGPGLLWMEATQLPDFGLAYGPGFSEDGGPPRHYPEPTWPPPLSAPRAPYHSAVLSVTRPGGVSVIRPTLPSARRPPPISATHPPSSPARQPPVPPPQQTPVISADSPDLPPAHQPPVIAITHSAQPPAPRPPLVSARSPKLPPAHQAPVFPDTHTTTHLPRVPANPAPRVTSPGAHQPPLIPDVPVLRPQATQLPTSPTAQSSLPLIPRSPGAPNHPVPVPGATQPPALSTTLPPHSPANQTSPISPTQPHPRAPQVPKGGGPSPTAAPTALLEAGLVGQHQRDDRWLLVALLVPTCVFLVVLLALGIVYCTRCGPHAPNKRVTDCYRWVTHAGSKGPTEPAPPRGSLPGVQTCRTSV